MDGRALVAWNLRKLRVAAAVSQEALAVDAGIDRTYVHRLEKGIENPTVAVLDQLARALGQPITAFFVVPGPHEPPPQPLRGGRKAARAPMADKRA